MAAGQVGRVSGATGIPAGPLKRPSLDVAVEINRAVRGADEWFDDPDDLDRIQDVLSAVDELTDPVELAAVLAHRVTRSQGFAEGNKRTALLLARWVLDRNGLDGSRFIPADDRQLADLLIRAASGTDVEADVVALLASR